MRSYDLSTISDLDAISPLETFLSEISNPNTRVAYHQACTAFIHWLETIGQNPLQVRSIHIATWRELVQRQHSIATTKLYLAALRTFFDWMCEQNLIPLNPARAVKSPKEVIAVGKTSFLEPAETRMLLASLQGERPIDLRDRALIGLMLFTFARIGAALRLNCDDLVRRSGSTWAVLHEKGGKIHEMPLHPRVEEWISSYLEVAASGRVISEPLFRSIDKKTSQLSDQRLHPINAYAMVKRRAKAAGIITSVTNHTFRATGITAYLANGGSLEMAAKLANHASTRTTQLYDRRQADLKMAEIHRIEF